MLKNSQSIVFAHLIVELINVSKLLLLVMYYTDSMKKLSRYICVIIHIL
jgi:hypothetical protein